MSTQNTVTEESIDEMLDNSLTQGWVVWGKEMHISYMLESGFIVVGRCACVDPANFDLELGKEYCRNSAKNQLWQLEGYHLQRKLQEEGVLPRYGGFTPIEVGDES